MFTKNYSSFFVPSQRIQGIGPAYSLWLVLHLLLSYIYYDKRIWHDGIRTKDSELSGGHSYIRNIFTPYKVYFS